MITISSNSWIGIWIGLEINLISFIPLILENRLNNSEANLNYFLIQAISSSALLFSIIFNLIIFKNWTILSNLFSYLTIFSLIIKIGAAPFHWWIINVSENVKWLSLIILLIWQKVAPLVLINYLNKVTLLLHIIIFINSLIGSLGGINQTSLRKILTFSSINHIGWIFSSIILSEIIFLSYFIIYSFLNICVILLFNFNQSFYLRQINFSIINSIFLKFYFSISILSLGGLPPFLGFLPKWIIIERIVSNFYNLVTLFLVITSLLTLRFYLNIVINSFIFNSHILNWLINLNLITNTKIIWLSFSIICSIFLFFFIILNFII